MKIPKPIQSSSDKDLGEDVRMKAPTIHLRQFKLVSRLINSAYTTGNAKR
jgi:hypothetical protein